VRQATLPFPILGVVAAQFLMMHYVEIRRWRDWQKPGSVDKDPLFAGNALPAHEVGYPGGIFDPMGACMRPPSNSLHARFPSAAWLVSTKQE
jgi:hypothetical protein